MLAASTVYAQEISQDAGRDTEPAIQQPAGNEDIEMTLHDAESLMKADKPDEAYNLLEPLEFDHSGEVRFDYLIGIAALDSGKPDKATLAFERVLAVDPEYAGARLDMARAYYQLGDMGRAKTEFVTVLSQHPSDAARTTILGYLDEIEIHETGKQTRFSAYAEGTVGHDTNVNNASETPNNIITPTLNPDSTELPDNYSGLAAGGEIIHNLNARFRVYAGADLSKRSNYKRKNFDTFNMEGRAGFIYGTEVDRYLLGFSGEQSILGSARYRDNAGLNGEWRHAVGSRDQMSLFGQYVQYRYADISLRSNDIDLKVAGAGWLHVLGNAQSTLSGSLYIGVENDVGPVTVANPGGGRTDGVKRFAGMRLGGKAVIGARTKLYASAGLQQGRFDNIDPVILSRRSDRLDDFTMGINWYLGDPWLLSLQFARYNNMSDVDLYSYDRSDYSLTIRRNFK